MSKKLPIILSEIVKKLAKTGSVLEIKDFKYGTGDYGYVCGTNIAGFLHVIP